MKKNKAQINFHFLSPATLPTREKLKSFIRTVFKKENRTLESINIIICDDEYLLRLNRQYLKHDYYTDILSFPLSALKNPLIAEMYISIDRVKDNAKNLDSTIKDELHRVIFHGVLHFCGYRDKKPSEIRNIRAMEDKYLRAYFKIP